MTASNSLHASIHKTSTIFFLFLIIILEGYVVLSSELLAIRQSIPFTGSGTETVSVIIAAVLMPLAFGYQAGGRFKPKPRFGVRKKLIFNIIVAMAFLIPALTYVIIDHLYDLSVDLGIKHRLLHISLYSALFIVTPVYLLGQTIPLISNYFGKEKLSRITGRILFFSTMGSFLGAVFSTLVLMANFGVDITVGLNFIILTGLVILLSKNKFSHLVKFTFVLGLVGVVLNSGWTTSKAGILESNLYNTISIVERKDQRHLLLNNSYSSMYSDSGRKYTYLEFAEKLGIKNMPPSDEPRDVLVVGAGAFTFGFGDEENNYDYVDIDKNLERVAEEHILLEELGENKTFHPMPARAFLAQTDKKYDMIFLDTYFGHLTLPEHLITLDFFLEIKEHLKDESVLLTNFVASPNFLDPFTRTLDNTVRAAFPYVSRHVAHTHYAPWNENEKIIKNIMYVYRHQADFGEPSVYTDNKNRAFLDKP